VVSSTSRVPVLPDKVCDAPSGRPVVWWGSNSYFPDEVHVVLRPPPANVDNWVWSTCQIPVDTVGVRRPAGLFLCSWCACALVKGLFPVGPAWPGGER